MDKPIILVILSVLVFIILFIALKREWITEENWRIAASIVGVIGVIATIAVFFIPTPLSPKPTEPSEPVHTLDIAPLIGRWGGTVMNGDFEIAVDMTLAEPCEFGSTCGSFNSPTIPCSGTFKLVDFRNETFQFQAENLRGNCEPGGADYLKPLEDGTLLYISRGPHGEAQGVLSRTESTNILPLPRTLAIPADAGWVDTGVYLETGQTVLVNANGEIFIDGTTPEFRNVGPNGNDIICDREEIEKATNQKFSIDCLLKGASFGAVIGRIGSNKPFSVGSTTSITAADSGNLFLAINDCCDFTDNTGAYNVVITLP